LFLLLLKVKEIASIDDFGIGILTSLLWTYFVLWIWMAKLVTLI